MKLDSKGRSNQSILKEISPGISLEGMMLKLKLQHFGHLMLRVDSLEKTLMLGGIGGSRRGDDRGWDGWMASPTRWTWVWVNSGDGDGQGGLACCHSWGHEESDMTEQLNWTELKGRNLMWLQRQGWHRYRYMSRRACKYLEMQHRRTDSSLEPLQTYYNSPQWNWPLTFGLQNCQK